MASKDAKFERVLTQVNTIVNSLAKSGLSPTPDVVLALVATAIVQMRAVYGLDYVKIRSIVNDLIDEFEEREKRGEIETQLLQ